MEELRQKVTSKGTRGLSDDGQGKRHGRANAAHLMGQHEQPMDGGGDGKARGRRSCTYLVPAISRPSVVCTQVMQMAQQGRACDWTGVAAAQVTCHGEGREEGGWVGEAREEGGEDVLHAPRRKWKYWSLRRRRGRSWNVEQ